jgi:hypothetical protein
VFNFRGTYREHKTEHKIVMIFQFIHPFFFQNTVSYLNDQINAFTDATATKVVSLNHKNLNPHCKTSQTATKLHFHFQYRTLEEMKRKS